MTNAFRYNTSVISKSTKIKPLSKDCNCRGFVQNSNLSTNVTSINQSSMTIDETYFLFPNELHFLETITKEGL